MDDFRVVGSLRREFAAYARSLGATQDAEEAVALAVSEAVTNVVKHAYVGRSPGEVRVEGRLDDSGRLLITVSDDGRGMVPRSRGIGVGLGLRLISYMCTDVTFTKPGERAGTSVTMRFALDRQEPPITRLRRSGAPLG
ncbi:MAG TPA: ATP-binding protein [Solirubrobacteraceae bacterium]|nr:ATP-binding protein [Solirubrobacteraceae bacterium]